MKSAWPNVALGRVLEERREIPPPEHILGGLIPIVSKIGFNDGKIQLRTDAETKTNMILVRPGDLVVSGINAAKGAIAIYGENEPGPIAATIHYGAYAPRKDRVDVRYLWWLLRSHLFRDILLRYVPGGIKTELKAKRLLPIPIPLPPLSEQRRIVERLDTLVARIEEAYLVKREAIKHANSVVAKWVVQNFSDGARRGWHSGSLDDYVVDTCYGTSEKVSDDASAVPILRMGNIQNGRLDLNALKFLHLSTRDRAKLLLKHGDILVNRTNSAELVGKCAVFAAEGEYAFASYLIRLRLDTSRAEPELVACYINSPLGRQYMLAEKTQMTGQANVNSTKLRALPIALPSIDEQRRLVAQLRALQRKSDELTAHQAQTATELDALFPAVIGKAFKGDL